MKKLTAVIAAALITITASLPVYAEPSESSPEEASVRQSTQRSDEGLDESTDTESSESERSKSESKTEEKSTEEKSDSKVSKADESGKSNSDESSKTEFKEYRVEEAEMDISLPSDMYVITRDTDADDPAFENYKRSKNEIMESFKESYIYIKASEKDFSCDITVTVVQNDDTEAVKNLSSLSDSELQSVIDNLLKQDVYKGCSKTKYNNTLFLTLTMEDKSGDTTISGIQEYTIINGKRVIITFQAYDGEIDNQEKDMFGKVMNSVKFDGVPIENDSSASGLPTVNDIDIRYIYIIIASVIAVVSLLIMIIAGMKYKKSKRLAAEQVDDEIETIGSKIQHNTTALVENQPDTDSEPEDIFSDSEIEKSNESAELDINENIIASPMTYESVSNQEGALGKLDENNVNITELPEEYSESDSEPSASMSTEPEGFTEIEATPAYEDRYSMSGITGDENNNIQSDFSDDYSDDQYLEALEENSKSEDDVVFAEITEKRHTDIEQMGIAEQGTDEQDIEQSVENESDGELSEYEKRFGKKRTTPAVTASAAASPDIMIVNTDEKRESKFEKHFGKLTPAVQSDGKTDSVIAESNSETVSEEKTDESTEQQTDLKDNGLESAVQDSSADDSAVDDQKDKSANKLFAKLIDKLKNHNPEDIDENASFFGDDRVQDDNTKDYSTEEKADKKQNEVSTDLNNEEEPLSEDEQPDIKDKIPNNIELEISKSPDGNLIIGALNENSGKPLDIEIKDSADIKSEQRKEMEQLGLEAADSNRIYDRRDEAVKEGFTVKTKDNVDEENISRFDRLFGADRDKTANIRESNGNTIDTASEEPDFEESAFEKRFGKNRNQSESLSDVENEAVKAAGASEAIFDVAAVTAAAAGTKAVEAVFDKAEKSKGKNKGKKSSSEPTRPETEEEFFEGVKADKRSDIKFNTNTPDEAINSDDVHKSRREEFMFERESGIIFEHAQRQKQPVQPMKTVFTNIPRLESVNADEYNRQYEEMKKSMPKNQAYAQRFSGAQNAYSDGSSSASDKKSASLHNVNTVSKGKKKFKKNGVKKTSSTPQNDNIIELYKGYDEEDPFTGETYKNEEMLIKDHKKNKGTMGSRFKKSFGKFFSGEVPEDEKDN